MFSSYFFPKVYFSGSYFEPLDGGVIPPTPPADRPPMVGMLINTGTIMGRW